MYDEMRIGMNRIAFSTSVRRVADRARCCRRRGEHDVILAAMRRLERGGGVCLWQSWRDLVHSTAWYETVLV